MFHDKHPSLRLFLFVSFPVPYRPRVEWYSASDNLDIILRNRSKIIRKLIKLKLNQSEAWTNISSRRQNHRNETVGTQDLLLLVRRQVKGRSMSKFHSKRSNSFLQPSSVYDRKDDVWVSSKNCAYNFRYITLPLAC